MAFQLLAKGNGKSGSRSLRDDNEKGKGKCGDPSLRSDEGENRAKVGAKTASSLRGALVEEMERV